MASELRQQPMVRDLLQGANLPGDPDRVELAFTHISLVFLAGDRVWKVKRPRRFSFLDTSTPGRRLHFCREEVRLNLRLAPQVYLAVVPVFRDARGFSLVRRGEVADHAVEMVRLPEARCARAMLREGELGAEHLEALAARLAPFYAAADRLPPAPEDFMTSLRENWEQAAALPPGLMDAGELARVRGRQEEWLARNAERLASRERRDGHGDLRLEHVYFLAQGPVAIDCIEFLDRFRVADPALDAAFLAMDLALHDADLLAGRFLGRFAYETDDYGLFPLVDGYQSYRALVRAKVAGFVAADPETDPATAARKREEIARHLRLALRLMEGGTARPRVLAVGGSIAAGKTTLAEALGRRLGLAVVSADATRKHLAGLPREARLGRGHYDEASTRRVEEEVLRRAEQVLLSGRSVILDTTFRRRALRRRARELAGSRNASFLFLECRVPEEVARRRLRARTGGVSDAREELLAPFLASFEPADELPPGEHLVLDATLPLENLLQRTLDP